MLLEWYLLPQVLKRFSPFGVYQRWICWHPPIPLSASIIYHVIFATSGGIGVECLQPSLDVSDMLCISSSFISSSIFVHICDRTYQRSTPMFDSGGTMLDGGFWAQHVGRHSLAVFHHKRSHHGCFCMPGAQEPALSAFNPLAAQQCVLCRQGFSSSVHQVVAGST